jgi:pimeloyl-ACP methyl ester carboxylesterase
MRDGRVLGYEEYVHPDDVPNISRLPVVLLIPGIPGCRLFSHPDVATGKLRTGVRLLVLERPGIGLSSPKPNNTILSWARDVEDLLKCLHIQRCSILGYSAGGPFAVSAAYGLGPGVVERLALISAVGPYDTPGAYKGMSWTYCLAWFLAGHMPSLIRRVVRAETPGILEDVVKVYRADIPNTPEPDQPVFADPQVEAMFCACSLEVHVRGQADTLAHEYALWGQPWGFDLKGVYAFLCNICATFIHVGIMHRRPSAMPHLAGDRRLWHSPRHGTAPSKAAAAL